MTRRLALAGVMLLTAASVSAFFVGCSATGPDNDWPPGPGPKVMTSFVPIYCFAANVAGDDASVVCLLDATGPHNYEATARDARRLEKADLFFINGLELDEKFADSLKKSCGNPNLEMIELAEGLEKKGQLLKMTVSPAHAGHGHGEFDPHVWLGIPEAISMVEAIRDALIKKDPAHKEGYTQRAADYVNTLKGVQEYGDKKLADKKDRNIISFHESLGYFARTFKLNVVASLEPVAGTEPDGKRIVELEKLCLNKDRPVRLIAVEPQYPQNTSASTLLRELQGKGVKDADLVVIDPIETVTPDERGPKYYETRMRANIDRLAEKMK
jgi:zinc transport system substrate-binding protein